MKTQGTTITRSAERKLALASAPASAGKTAMLKHLNGETLTQRQGIIAKCADCLGYYDDGKVDCRMPHCPLYPWMPYREDKPEKKVSARAPMSAERIAKMTAGRAAKRAEKRANAK
jgi:hypothetical protein